MLLVTRKPSNTIVIVPRKVLPLAFGGIFHVQTASRPTKRPDCARSALDATRPTQITRPPWRSAPVSDLAACRRSANVFPAAGLAGVDPNFLTTSVGLASTTVNGYRPAPPPGATSPFAFVKSRSPV